MRFVFLVCLSFFLLHPANSRAGERTRLSPVNPEFNSAQSPQPKTDDGRVLGHRAGPLDLSHLSRLRPTARKQFPAQFDLRDSGQVTPVRDQGDCGSCWTFAAFASLESCLIPEVTDPDFAEAHLNSDHGFDWWPCMGGTYAMAAAYLLRWDGPLNEEDDPYPHKTRDMTPKRHVQDVLFLGDRSGPLDNDYIKEVVTTHGAVHTTVIWSDSNFNEDTAAFYSTSTGTGNHDIAIVGWDDSYPASNFNSTPPGDGAFICKNSWGLEHGIDGYFFYSYYDGCVGDNTAYINAEETTNYTNIYQYDPLGWVRSLGADGLHGIEPKGETHWGANVFTAGPQELLAAVGFYGTSWNSGYRIQVYTGVTDDPASGTLAGEISGDLVFPGFHTIPVKDLGITLAASEKFAVAIEFTTPGYDYPVPVETRIFTYSGDAEADPGQSYVRAAENDPWTDLTEEHSRTNVCIKAYTTQDCDDGDPCTDDTFDGNGCVFTPVDGLACDDGDLCTAGDICQAGVCAGEPLECTPLDACHDAGSCDPATGECTDPQKPDGSACEIDDLCAEGACQAGVCEGSNPIACQPLDQCHDAGVCDPATGLCSNPEKTDGSACDDSDLCTQSDSCQAGVCVGADPVDCPATDECHQAGSCDPASGACDNPAQPDGTACTNGTCQSGECTADDPEDPGDDSSAGCGFGAERGQLPGLSVLFLFALLIRRKI